VATPIKFGYHIIEPQRMKARAQTTTKKTGKSVYILLPVPMGDE
jgi:hypothetical protein